MDLAVEGIACGACIARIEGAVKRLPGVTDARLNFTNRRLHVAWSDALIKPAQILAPLESIGYRGHPFVPLRAEQDEAAEARRLTRCLAVAGFAAMNIMLLSVSVWSGNVTDITPETRDFFHWASALIALPAAAYAGRPFFASAWRALRARTPQHGCADLARRHPRIGHVGDRDRQSRRARLFRFRDHAAVFPAGRAHSRSRHAPQDARGRRQSGGADGPRPRIASRATSWSRCRSPRSTAGDRVLVRPGERVPADGVVLAGASEIDESLITGETARRKVAGRRRRSMPAASISAGALTLRVTAAGGATLIDEIERLLEKAASAKSRSVRLADRAARLYAPMVHAAAALTAGRLADRRRSLHDAVVTAIAVLIITCPCALALAIPAVQVVASGALFRAGVILNSGDAIERLAEVDTVVFDKTGTLTLPEPRVVNAAAIDPDLLQKAARLALSSRHPLAVALAREAALRTPFDGAVEEPGQGVRALIDGVEARLGSADFCGVADRRRARARHCRLSASAMANGRRRLQISQKLAAGCGRGDQVALPASGSISRILSGDRADAVRPVAEALGIAQWQGELKPAEKIAIIETLKRQGRRVLMVGDGLNDAPALAAAHVSLSPITAADVTQAQADAVFLGERLAPVVDAIAIARRARAADDAEPVAGGGLQCRRGSDRHRRRW